MKAAPLLDFAGGADGVGARGGRGGFASSGGAVAVEEVLLSGVHALTLGRRRVRWPVD
ncbi:hypothetical protein AB0K49_27475 [Streptomyces decoyicus]|uniref:hypothetical protein n=1 Tax=Streptomyces decoyicus TaxID=249567 RepID=UPI00345CB5BB